MQLRRLEFASIGCLERDPGTGKLQVGKSDKSIDMNELELEGAHPFRIHASYRDDDGLIKSAGRYVDMLMDIADDAFEYIMFMAFSDLHTKRKLYYNHYFRNHIKQWEARHLGKGPFVLAHGDFYPQNLIVNDEGDIVGVLDWERSHVVPRQLFYPPLWLHPTSPLNDPLVVKKVYEEYAAEADRLFAIMRVRERERHGNEVLSDEREEGKRDGGYRLAYAVQDWGSIFGVCNSFRKEVAAFMEEPARQASVVKKGAEYHADVAAIRRLRETATLAPRLHGSDPNSQVLWYLQSGQSNRLSSRTSQVRLPIVKSSSTPWEWRQASKDPNYVFY